MANKDNEYGRSNLVIAALLFIGFVVLAYFLPSIMGMLGGENPWIAGGVVAGFLILPFVGLWLRGRAQRKER